jgi:hypothetical protein
LSRALHSLTPVRRSSTLCASASAHTTANSSPSELHSQRQHVGARHRPLQSVGAGRTGNDPSAGSPTETLLRLLLPLSDPVWPSSRGTLTAAPRTAPPPHSLTVQKPHYIIRSVVATGGVYKGQGRNQRKLLTRAYWEFLVRGAEFQAPVPTTKGHEGQRRFSGCPVLSDRERTDERACPPQRRERVASFSVARVRPRPSKGITDLLLLRLRAAS